MLDSNCVGLKCIYKMYVQKKKKKNWVGRDKQTKISLYFFL